MGEWVERTAIALCLPDPRRPIIFSLVCHSDSVAPTPSDDYANDCHNDQPADCPALPVCSLASLATAAGAGAGGRYAELR